MPVDTPITVPADGVELEAVLRLPDRAGPFPAVVVCHPHPQYGGNMTNNVVLAVVRGLVASGIAALRFNFRGVGQSTGSHEGGVGERDDASAAVGWLRAHTGVDPARIGLAGYSFGESMAAGAVGTGVAALALIAPPIGDDRAALPDLANYPGPVLILAGAADEYCTPAALAFLARRLDGRADLQVLARVDHFWGGDEPEIATRVGAFFGASFNARA